MNREETKEVQEILRRDGFYYGLIDGIWGPRTEAAFQRSKQIPMGITGVINQASIDLILEFEVGGEKGYNPHPEWPGEASGITFGIGWDIGHQGDNFKEDWADRLSIQDFSLLNYCVGIKGERAHSQLGPVKHIYIPWKDAYEVFLFRTIPKYARITKEAFPGSENLHPNAFGALVSLVYNRGASMTGDRRSEMRNIRDIVKNSPYDVIAGNFRHMTRLWKGTSIEAGMARRREAEAKLVESAIS